MRKTICCIFVFLLLPASSIFAAKKQVNESCTHTQLEIICIGDIFEFQTASLNLLNLSIVNDSACEIADGTPGILVEFNQTIAGEDPEKLAFKVSFDPNTTACDVYFWENGNNQIGGTSKAIPSSISKFDNRETLGKDGKTLSDDERAIAQGRTR